MASNDGDRQSTVWTGLGVLILVVFVGLIGFAIQGTDFFLYRFFAPPLAAGETAGLTARREVLADGDHDRLQGLAPQHRARRALDLQPR